MKIITDTSSLFSPADSAAQDISVLPVSVAIDGKSFKDYAEISSEQFLELIADGGIPTSSQPALGDILDLFESCNEEMLFLTVGDGLSGTYQTIMGARNCLDNPDRIRVVNSKSLAGPLRYLVKKAVVLKNRGFSLDQIAGSLQASIESSLSFVIPENFEFLRRSGRLSSLTAKLGGTLKLLPVLTQTEDKTRIVPISIKRSWTAAVDTIVHRMQEAGVNQNYLISVSHAGAYQRAVSVLEQIISIFSAAETEILSLSPSLITHGGPGCIVVQAIRK